MPRPRVDGDAVRDRIVAIAEQLLVESGGRRLVLSEIADRMGVSQSYIYRHFANKEALAGELARRWFENVEAAGEAACGLGGPWQDRLRQHIVTVMNLKKAAYEADPDLFAAYLRIAEAHRDIVAHHAEVLHRQLREILKDAVSKRNLAKAVTLTMDATVQFRIPHSIAAAPDAATPERANAVLDAIIGLVEQKYQSAG